MAISLTDAVLIFKGDQSDLDAAFASVPPRAEKEFRLEDARAAFATLQAAGVNASCIVAHRRSAIAELNVILH